MASDLPMGWFLAPLGDLVDERGITYGVVQPGRFVDEGVPLVRVADFANGGPRAESLARVTRAVSAGHQRSVLRGGEVLITLVGTVGLVAVADEELIGANVARAVGVIPLRDSSLVAWCATALRGSAARQYFTDRLNTTVQATLNLRDLAAFAIPVPPAAELEAIMSVVEALDDKIESNRQAIKASEGIIDNCFLEWLKRSRGQCAALASVARFVNGRNFTKGADGFGRPVLRIKELNGGVTKGTVRSTVDVPGDHVACPGDLLLAWSGTLGVHRWYGPVGIINQHIFKVIPDSLPTWFVEQWLYRHIDRFRRIAADKATTMGHIKRGDLAVAEVVVPTEPETRELRTICDPLDALRGALWGEERTLIVIRDALLPKLVSGQLRVPLSNDPEEQVGAAVEALSGS